MTNASVNIEKKEINNNYSGSDILSSIVGVSVLHRASISSEKIDTHKKSEIEMDTTVSVWPLSK